MRRLIAASMRFVSDRFLINFAIDIGGLLHEYPIERELSVKYSVHPNLASNFPPKFFT